MRTYIVDSDRNSRMELKAMIEKRRPGSVMGTSSEWEEGWQEIRKVRPDLILTDLFFPALKTLDYIRRTKAEQPETTVLVVSQSNHAGLMRQAYEAGAELMIHKPVHAAEIGNVMRLLELAKTMEWMMERTGRTGREPPEFRMGMQSRSEEENRESHRDRCLRRLKGILQELGISGQSGSRDVIRMITYLLDEELELGDMTIRELCERQGQNAKSVEQRIRRAAADGLTNLACRGMEDYADPVFNEYAGLLYSFEQVKKEMNYIRGKSEKHGNVRTRNFLNGLMDCCQNR